MSCLIFGKTGQVATELARLAPNATFLGRDEADLMDAAACAEAIWRSDVRAVINAAAWTAVDKAESDPDAAMCINGLAPAAMARAAAAKGIPIVHISTDYVFDGRGTAAFVPGAPTGPLNVYGRTKLAGEDGVRAVGGAHAILRTSWIFSAHGSNFVKTMLRLGAERDRLTIVADQVGGPTPAADLAAACLTIADKLAEDAGKSGTYHISGAPDVSWADFAREIFRSSGRGCIVEDVPSSAYPTPAKRPANSRLDMSTTIATFGVARPDWRRGLQRVLTELGASAA